MIRIVIAEDQRILRGALGACLILKMTWKCRSSGKWRRSAETYRCDLQPDICLMDIEMPLKSGLEVAAELKQSAFFMQGDHANDICTSRLF